MLVGLVIVILLLIILSKHLLVRAGREQRYRVSAFYSNKEEAAQLLEDLNHRLLLILREIKKKYHIGEPHDMPPHPSAVTSPWRDNMRALLRNYNTEAIVENPPIPFGSTSYTIDKGRLMKICLRQLPDAYTLVDIDTLTFVALHEMAHIANYRGWGHKRDFWVMFRQLLKDAAETGLYVPVDYKKNPVRYCGLTIDYNPYYDAGLAAKFE